MKFSVVIPVFNEEANIAPLAQEIIHATRAGEEVEVLLVDDGSLDHTWERIQEVATANPLFRGIRSARNRGQTSAMLTGLHQARGDILITMDGDLQNNPADIPKLVDALDGVDVVCGFRAKRRDSFSRRLGSRIGNTIRNLITDDGLLDTGCSLKAFRRECLADIPPVNGAHRFMGAYFKLHGHTIKQIPVDHRPRQFGQSKYTNLKRLPRTVFDLIGFVWYRSRLVRPTKDLEFTH